MGRLYALNSALGYAIAAMSLAAVSVSAPLYAQGGGPDVDENVVEEIVVTGSRIKRANLVSTSPVTQVNSDEFLFRGITRVEDLLNDLPQVLPDQSSATNNGASGTATVDLRGLFAPRTLTLLNGRRLPAGSPAYAISPDINQIPGMMLDRVEVLTGGASATYGSDAIAGVVNFITIDDFQGVQFDYQFSQYQHSNDSALAQYVSDAGYELPPGTVNDGGTHNFSLMLGIDDAAGRGNLTAYATYRDIKAVTQSRRDYSACALQGGTTDLAEEFFGVKGFFCGGSSTIPEGRFTDFGLLTNPDCVMVPAPTPEDPDAVICNRVPQFDYATGMPTGAVDGNGNLITMPEPVLPWFGNTSGNGTLPWPGRFDFLVEPGTDMFVNRAGHPNAFYNYGPTNLFMRPDERITFGAIGHYSVSDVAEIYLELNYMDDKTVSQLAPSGSFFWPNSVSCGNPLLSQQQFDLLCTRYNLTASDSQIVFIGRRNVEGGSRADNLRHTSYRGVLGVRGDIGSSWEYDAYLNYGAVAYTEVYDEDLSITRMLRALDVVTDPASGQPVCASALNGSDPQCVPWNIFESGAVTQQAIDYITLPIYYTGSTEQHQLSAYVSGDLGDYGFKLPTADEAVKVVFGLEYRKELLDYEPDRTAQEGGAAGQADAQSPVHGSYAVSEFFAEASVPLLEGKTAAELLSVDLAYRYSDYSTDKQTDTYKIGAEWMFHPSLRLRGSYQHAVRVGNIHELFRPLANSGGNGEDTCQGANPESTLAECQLTGLTAAQYGTLPEREFSGFNTKFGGNPDLDPEESDTVSFGFILSPEFLSGLTLSVDWFDIDVTGAIAEPDSDFIFDQCIATGAARFCDAIHRDSATGLLWLGDAYVNAANTNIGFIQTTGIDVVADFQLPIGRFGDLNFNLVGTYLDTWDWQELPGEEPFDCTAVYEGGPCIRARPAVVTNFRTSWLTPWDASVSLLWRYLSDVRDGSGAGNHIPSYSFLDLAGLWDVSEGIVIRIGINNILDKDPPFTPFGSGNSLPETYDALGRYWFTGVSVNF
jgi:iron complex outermembrane receptor protein